jgi:hypothetical protein
MTQVDPEQPQPNEASHPPIAKHKWRLRKEWWEDFKTWPDFEDIMKRQGLTEDDIEIL